MNEDRNFQVRDQVCGKDLDLAEVPAMFDYHGWAYFFCSTACRDAFCADPDQFTKN